MPANPDHAPERMPDVLYISQRMRAYDHQSSAGDDVPYIKESLHEQTVARLRADLETARAVIREAEASHADSIAKWNACEAERDEALAALRLIAAASASNPLRAPDMVKIAEEALNGTD